MKDMLANYDGSYNKLPGLVSSSFFFILVKKRINNNTNNNKVNLY